jgi:hypothetical protein
MKQKGGEPYRINRRTKHKTTGKDLSGYAIDVTIRANGEEAYFLQDHNSHRNVMPHSNLDDLIDTLKDELERNHAEHFTP